MKITDFKKGNKYIANATYKTATYDSLVDFYTGKVSNKPIFHIQVNKGDIVTVQYISKITINNNVKTVVGLSNKGGISVNPQDADIALYSDYVEPKSETTKNDTKTTPAIWNTIQVAANRAKYLTIIGMLGGVGFAYYKKSSWKGYVGWGALFSLAGSLIALASVKIIPPKTKTGDKTETPTTNSDDASKIFDDFVNGIKNSGKPITEDVSSQKQKFIPFYNSLGTNERNFIKDYFNGLVRFANDTKNTTSEQTMVIMFQFDKQLTDKYGSQLITSLKTKSSNSGVNLFA